MSIKAGRVGVSPQDVDESGHVTVGGLTPEQNEKLNKSLVSPSVAPTEKELVGVGTSNEQIMVKIGANLSLSGENSPFTLDASGGAEFGNITVPNGTIYSPILAKIGNLVVGYFAVAKYNFTAGSVVATIPEGFKPAYDVYFPVYNSKDETVKRGHANQIGQIKLDAGDSFDGEVILYMSFAYKTN